MEDFGSEVAGGPEAYTFKDLVMRHLYNISKLYCVELRGGYYTLKKDKHGEEVEVYVPDSREALSNAIMFLAQLLMCKFDKPAKAAHKTFLENTAKLKTSFLKKTKIDDTEVLGEAYYNEDEKKILEEYKIKKLHYFQDLFTELSLFLGRRNFLEIGGDVDKDET